MATRLNVSPAESRMYKAKFIEALRDVTFARELVKEWVKQNTDPCEYCKEHRIPCEDKENSLSCEKCYSRHTKCSRIWEYEVYRVSLVLGLPEDKIKRFHIAWHSKGSRVQASATGNDSYRSGNTSAPATPRGTKERRAGAAKTPSQSPRRTRHSSKFTPNTFKAAPTLRRRSLRPNPQLPVATPESPNPLSLKLGRRGRPRKRVVPLSEDSSMPPPLDLAPDAAESSTFPPSLDAADPFSPQLATNNAPENTRSSSLPPSFGTANHLESELQKLRVQLNRLSDDLLAAKKNEADTKKRNDDLLRAYEKEKRAGEVLRQDMGDLGAELNDHEARVNELKAKAEFDILSSAEHLRSQVAVATSEVTAQLEKEVNAHEALKATHKSISEERAALQRAHTELLASNSDLKAQLEKEVQAHEALKSRHVKLSDEHEGHLGTLQAEVETLKAVHERALQENEALQQPPEQAIPAEVGLQLEKEIQAREALQAAHDKLSKENEELRLAERHTIATGSDALNRLEKEIWALKAAYERVSKENENLRRVQTAHDDDPRVQLEKEVVAHETLKALYGQISQEMGDLRVGREAAVNARSAEFRKRTEAERTHRVFVNSISYISHLVTSCLPPICSPSQSKLLDVMRRVHKDLNSVILQDFDRSQRLAEDGNDNTNEVDDKTSILGKRKSDSVGDDEQASLDESPPGVADKRRRVEES